MSTTNFFKTNAENNTRSRSINCSFSKGPCEKTTSFQMSSHSSNKSTWHHNNKSNSSIVIKNNSKNFSSNINKVNIIHHGKTTHLHPAITAGAALAYYERTHLFHPIINPAPTANNFSQIHRGRSQRGGQRGGGSAGGLVRPRSHSAHGSVHHQQPQHQQQKWGTHQVGGTGAGGVALKARPATPVRLNYDSLKTQAQQQQSKQQTPPASNSGTTSKQPTANSKNQKAAGILVPPVAPPTTIKSGGAAGQIATKKHSQHYLPPPPISVDEDVPEFTEEQHICQLHNETLDKCFGETGTYVCKSYGPRCFIFQKVINIVL